MKKGWIFYYLSFMNLRTLLGEKSKEPGGTGPYHLVEKSSRVLFLRQAIQILVTAQVEFIPGSCR